MHIIKIVLVVLFDTCSASDVGLSPTQMIEKHGYVSETHYLTTEDGYILTYHRIPRGINETTTTKRPAVLLQHGLTSSSADFVNMGPKRSLGYLLADAGYDVWLGNARGNAFSRNHKTLNVVSDAQKFFNFSWHEIGYYDYAAAIDYILDFNGDEALYYIGHSQGTTAFFVLTSTRPEYNEKIKVAHMLAPSTYMTNHPDDILKLLLLYMDQIKKLLFALGIYEIPFVEAMRGLGTQICVNEEFYILCDVVFAVLNITDLTEIDPDTIAVVMTNAPSNSAIKQVIHYGQLMKHGRFAQYDYSAQENLAAYGTETSPEYDISKVTAPIALYYAANDGVQFPEDVNTLKSQLSTVAEDYLVPWEPFNHIDFLFARDVVNLVYNKLLEVNKKY